MVSITVNQKCSRCHRDGGVTYDTVQAAEKGEQAAKKKSEGMAALKTFIEKMPPETVPDFFSVFMGKVDVTHEQLCTGGGAKSDCQKSVANYLELAEELGPRKPRKAKAAATTGDSANAPIPLTAVVTPTAAPAHTDHHQGGKKHG
jgi:hypothetical protein